MKKNILLLMIFIKCSGIPHGYERISDESKIIKYYDKVEKITFFHHLELNNLNRNRNLLIYIREQEGRKSLHLKISYRGNNWIFFDEILLTNGDQNIIFNIPLYNKYTDVSQSGTVKEETSILLNEKDIELLKYLFKSNFTMRLKGKNYHDKNFKNCNACLEIINLYEK